MSENQPMRRRSFLLAAAGAAAAANAQTAAGGEAQRTPAEAVQGRGVADLVIHGEPFAVYNFDSTQAAIYRPFVYPLMGPNQRPITQNGEFPGSLRGHYWHRSLFVAHQKINGVSFWEEREADCGRIVHTGFDAVNSGERAELAERLAWRDLTGRDLLLERRSISAPSAPRDGRILDIAIHLTAAEDVTMEATPYNLLACRAVNAMCPLPKKVEYARRYGSLADFSPMDEGGRIVNSEGQADGDCRGARARWCDFSGPLGDGSRGGVCLMDHPSNPRHPTPWHNWNDMTINASPTFHEPLSLRKGESVRFAYRILVHAGNAEEADAESAWRRYAETRPFGD